MEKKGKKPKVANFATKNQALPLEWVSGHTVESHNHIASSPDGAWLALTAGCVLVLRCTADGSERYLLARGSPKPLSCVAFSSDGRLVAAGETGNNPAVSVWSVQEGKLQGRIETMHQYGLLCVAFSPDGQQLATAGTEHDGRVAMWQWGSGAAEPRGCATFAAPVRSVAVGSRAGSPTLLVAGNQFLCQLRFPAADGAELVRTDIGLGPYAEATYVAVAHAGERVYAVTMDGVLVTGMADSALDKWVNLKAANAYCLGVHGDLVACGCSDGTVRVFSTGTLDYVMTLPRPHPLLRERAFCPDMFRASASRQRGAYYADSVACRVLSPTRVVCVYSDRTLVEWNTADRKQGAVARLVLPHGGGVWQLQPCPEIAEGVAAGAQYSSCGSDGAVRFWRHAEGGLVCCGVMRIVRTTTKEDPAGVPALRTHCITPDGTQMAAGDSQGGVALFDLPSGRMLSVINAHSSEVLQLAYSRVPAAGSAGAADVVLLVSGGRDRLIHVFDATRADDCRLLATLDDHSAAVSCLQLLPPSVGTAECRLVSAAADKSLIFRHLSIQADGKLAVRRYRHAQVASSIQSMSVAVAGGQPALACCSKDKRRFVRYYNLETGKMCRSRQVSYGPSGAGELQRVRIDQIGAQTALLASSDRVVAMADTNDGHCIAFASGHSEQITSMAYSADYQHVLSSACDGCVMVWAVPEEVRAALSRETGAFSPSSAAPEGESVLEAEETSTTASEEATVVDGDDQSEPDPFAALFQEDDGRLPSWLLGGGTPDTGAGPPWADGGEWNDRIDDDDAFSTFDCGGKNRRRFTIEPSELERQEDGPSAAEGDGFVEDSVGIPADRDEAPEPESRRVSISSVFMQKEESRTSAGGSSSIPPEPEVEEVVTPSQPALTTAIPSDTVAATVPLAERLAEHQQREANGKAFSSMQSKKDTQRKELEEQVRATRERLMRLGLLSKADMAKYEAAAKLTQSPDAPALAPTADISARTPPLEGRQEAEPDSPVVDTVPEPADDADDAALDDAESVPSSATREVVTAVAADAAMDGEDGENAGTEESEPCGSCDCGEGDGEEVEKNAACIVAVEVPEGATAELHDPVSVDLAEYAGEVPELGIVGEEGGLQEAVSCAIQNEAESMCEEADTVCDERNDTAVSLAGDASQAESSAAGATVTAENGAAVMVPEQVAESGDRVAGESEPSPQYAAVSEPYLLGSVAEIAPEETEQDVGKAEVALPDEGPAASAPEGGLARRAGSVRESVSALVGAWEHAPVGSPGHDEARESMMVMYTLLGRTLGMGLTDDKENAPAAGAQDMAAMLVRLGSLLQTGQAQLAVTGEPVVGAAKVYNAAEKPRRSLTAMPPASMAL